MAVDDRPDQLRDPLGEPDPARNNTALPEPDAETAQTDTIDTNPSDQGTSPGTPDTDS